MESLRSNQPEYNKTDTYILPCILNGAGDKRRGARLLAPYSILKGRNERLSWGLVRLTLSPFPTNHNGRLCGCVLVSGWICSTRF